MSTEQQTTKDGNSISGWQSRSKWTKVVTVALVLIALAFGVSLLRSSQAIVGSVHKRNFHIVDLGARGLESWPRDVGVMARNNVSLATDAKPEDLPRQRREAQTLIDAKGSEPLQSMEYHHPDLGDFRIYYRQNCSIPDEVRFSDGALPGQSAAYTVQGQFASNDTKIQTTCYVVSVPLDRLVDMRFDDREIRNFLIVASDGRVIQQLGDSKLPIVGIGKLGTNNGLAQGLVAKATGEKVASDGSVGLEEVRNVAPITIAGTDYLAYVKPFILKGDGVACPLNVKGGVVANGVNQCYAVALMPAHSLRRSWLSPPPTLTIGFGLCLAALLALLPLIRLLLIGGAESVSGIEVLGIVLGLPAAITIATFAILFVIDVKSERSVAERETRAVAQRLAAQAGDEIGDTLSAAFGAKEGSSITKAVAKCPTLENPGTLINCPLGFGKGRLQLELFLKIGPDGKIAPKNQSYAFRDKATPSFDVSARDYFLRLRRGEGFIFQMSEKAKPFAEAPCEPKDGIKRFTIDQVRSQTDGYDKTVLALPCPDGEADNSALMVLTLKAFLAPVLPLPLHYMVVDTSKPDMPVIFHEARGHAGVESFVEQADLSGAQLGRLTQMGSALDDASGFGFRARYDGERTILSAAKVANTPWLVLAWQRTDAADGIAARTASRAMAGWIAIALLFLATCIVGLTATPNAWRQFWPHESACEVYEHLTRVLSNAAMALLVKFFWGQLGAFVFLMFLVVIWGWSVRQIIMNQREIGLTWQAAVRQALPKTDGWKFYSRFLPLTLYLILLVFFDSPFWATLSLWVFAPAYVAWQLEAPKDSNDPLTPRTENAFRNALLAFFACISLVPALMLWSQGRSLSHHMANEDRLVAVKHALVARADAVAGIRRAIFLPPETTNAAKDDQRGLPLLTDESDKIANSRAPAFASILWTLQTGVDSGAVKTCASGGQSDWLCQDSAKGHTDPAFASGVVPRKVELLQSSHNIFGKTVQLPSLFVAFGVLSAIVLLLAFVWQATTRMLDALAGFRVPLGAVKGRRVKLANSNHVGGWKRDVSSTKGETGEAEGLSVRTLLVAPQQAVRDRLESYPEAWSVDLADMLLDKAKEELADKLIKDDFTRSRRDGKSGPALLIASGLELILRDIPRRQAALKFLEVAGQKLGKGDLSGIVVIAEMSPLERILDAFESGGTADESTRITREELRWARLFQTYESIIFAPIDKVGYGVFPTIEQKPVWRLIAELRWLPSAVIDGATGGNRTPLMGLEYPVFPIEAEDYQKCFHNDILRWASEVDPCSEAAAIDHLRSTLIEHYEQCWVASTLAERLVLDAIARGNFVNILRALPLQSLVRRGLVVLDPSPRLMNRSFALFVRQAERPNTLDSWRKDQPRSSWMAAKLPLLIAIPVAVVGLTLAAAESGQELTAIFSVLAAGAPALLGTLFKTVRPA